MSRRSAKHTWSLLLTAGLVGAAGSLAGAGLHASGEGTVGSASAAAAPRAEASARVRDLRQELRSFLPLRRWSGATWGVLVTSLERGDTLFAHGAHSTFIPASNLKLLTTAAALYHLGPDFRYRTFLLTTSPVEDGTLRGDLVLYGTGDPSFAAHSQETGDQTFRAVARSLREQGIRVVEGDVLGDGTYFPGASRPEGWSWRDLNDWFAAPVTGLSYNENITTLRIRPGPGPDSPLRVETIPEDTPIPLRITGRTVAGRAGHPVWAVREDPQRAVEIVGELQARSAGLWRRLTVNDPALYAATRLRSVLEQEGIEVRGGARVVAEPSNSPVSGRELWAPAQQRENHPRILAEQQSDSLVQLLRVVNKRSHNLYAEAVLRTLGRVVDGDASFEAGSRVIQRFMVETAGVPAAEAQVADGSGLSPKSRISPYAFVRAMDFLARSSLEEAFWSTLPEAGNYRELSRMYRSPAAGNLRAKTGTIEGVSALSGLVRAGSGERLIFSIISNDVPSTSVAKRVEDRIGIRLAEFWRPSAGLEVGVGGMGRD